MLVACTAIPPGPLTQSLTYKNIQRRAVSQHRGKQLSFRRTKVPGTTGSLIRAVKDTHTSPNQSEEPSPSNLLT